MSDRLDAMTYLQALVIGVVLAGLYYYFLYSAQNVDVIIAELDQNISTLNAQIAEKDALIKEKQQVEAEILKNSSSFSKSREIITKGFAQNQALETLTNTSRDLGLSIESLGTFSSWGPDQKLEKAVISLNLEGSFEQMMFLFSDLTRRENFYTVDKISMVGGRDDEKNDALQINIDFKVLRESARLTEKPTAPNPNEEVVDY